MRKSVFKMPKPVSISGRSSTITNSFVNAIIPLVMPTDNDVREALEILEMNSDTICCSYCGDTHTEWDHLRAIVSEKKPTGYISEIQNLVPACGKCNQSKGNKEWYSWIGGSARLSPTTRKITDIERRIRNLEAYENWRPPTKVDFAEVVCAELWDQHWLNWQDVQRVMEDAQDLAGEIKIQIAKHLNDSTG